MLGIDLNKPIEYKYASLRYFRTGEHHVSRIYPYDVLLLIFDGVLRFTEDGIQYELGPGQYHIQKHNSVQSGEHPSDAPQYLYVHFTAEWTEEASALPCDGVFDFYALKTVMEEMDSLSHDGAPYIIQAGKFYEILSKLHRNQPRDSLAGRIASYLEKECYQAITLEMLCQKFHFSKNHIINVFRKTYGMTPVAYANYLRIKKAEYLIEVTSDSLDRISAACGFQSYSHFYKLFVRKNQTSPESWRERKRLEDQAVSK